MKIWLDDIRPAPEGWEWAKTPGEFFALLGFASENRGVVDSISFDNDLGSDEIEGWEVAKMILDMILDGEVSKPYDMFCHSANVAAHGRIRGIISDIYERI